MIYNKIDELIGNTPIIKLTNNIHAKLEKFNLTGSSKDRIVKAMIDDGISKKQITEGTVIIEATSGNTGIALACLSIKHKLKCVIVMPSNMSKERIKLLHAYNTKVILTDKSRGMEEAIKVAKLLQKRIPNSFIPSQFDNDVCIDANYTTTGPEIYQDIPDADCIIAGIGTGSTISGVGKYMKEHNRHIHIVGVEPASSPLLTLNYYHNHKIQGIGPNFIPTNFKSEYVDEIVSVTDELAYEGVKELVSQGLLLGISSGAVYQVAKLLQNKYQKIVAIFPDGGEKYLSVEGLFE